MLIFFTTLNFAVCVHFFHTLPETNSSHLKIGAPWKRKFLLVLVSGSVPWFIRENPIKMDDLGVPLFLETPKYIPIGSILMVYISLQFLPSKITPKLSLRQAVKVKSCSPSTKMRCCKKTHRLRFRKVHLVFVWGAFFFYFEAWYINYDVSPTTI